MTWSRVRSLPLVLILLIGIAACDSPAATQLDAVDLADVDQLADAFNQVDSDSPRLILLLSPT